jgi:hypothetical protein
MTLASSIELAPATDQDVTAVTRSTRGRTARPPAASPERPSDADAAEVDDGSTAVVQRAPASERRRAAERLIELWTDVARDIALCQRGIPGAVREIGLLDETSAIAARLDEPAVAAFLERLGRGAVLLASNVSPELVIDDLALAVPVPTRAAA